MQSNSMTSRFQVFASAYLIALMVFASGHPLYAGDSSVAEPKKAAPAPEVTTEQIKFFETHVRPLLAAKCFKCHGQEKQSGELRLDGRAAMLAGGESGESIVPGKPTESLLIEAINYESFEMPPDGKLSDDEIAVLTKWVSIGAPWPGKDVTANVRPAAEKITAEDRDYWCFQPITYPDAPQVENDTWSRGDIDRFILDKLRNEKLSPQNETDRLTLIRRVTQSATGLPPTIEDVDAFLSDESPDAYEKLVDRLMASPRHGEQMARFWLDLVRYAESDGYKQDSYRPHAWRYRDYVIRSFNEDKPYDQFVTEQLAGDEVAPHDPDALVATGYYRLGIYEYNQRDAETQWRTMQEDITDTTSDVFLAMGLGCAKCHDHKFDPLLQADYYRLRSFFSNIALRDDVPLATPDERAAYIEQLAKWEAATVEIRAERDQLVSKRKAKEAEKQIAMFSPEIRAIMDRPYHERTAYERQIAHLVDLQVIIEEDKVPGSLKDKEKEQWDALSKQLAEFDDIKPKPLQSAETITDVDAPPSPLFIPGKERLGEITPGFLAVLDETALDVPAVETAPGSSGRRTAFAKWVTDPKNPLTARVIVNRIWQQHFGTGLVATASDFGRLGEPPSHPELLDWLASEFMAHGWSMKWLHRELLMSATFRQGAGVPTVDAAANSSIVKAVESAMMVDPQNRLLSRFPVRRLTGEQVRDAALSAAGELQFREGGSASDSGKPVRSIYLKVERNDRDDLLAAFDHPDRLTSSGDRSITTTPTQALLLINSDWGLKRASAFAERVKKLTPGSRESQVQSAYRIAIGRDPHADEVRSAVTFMDQVDELTKAAVAPEQEGLRFKEQPATGSRGLYITDGEKSTPPMLEDTSQLPTGDFTIEAVVQLDSLYADATVRTIASQWDSDTTHPGWAVGVTSTKSGYTPRNFILQLVGNDASGKLTYEVVPSGIHLELNRPYAVACRVELKETGERGVRFTVQDLSDDASEPKHAAVKHSVVSGIKNSQPFILGGRAKQSRHRWNGTLDNVRLTAGLIPDAALGVTRQKVALDNNGPRPPAPLGEWAFDSDDNPLAATEPNAPALTIGTPGGRSTSAALIDFCHVLLNSNEFLYLD